MNSKASYNTRKNRNKKKKSGHEKSEEPGRCCPGLHKCILNQAGKTAFLKKKTKKTNKKTKKKPTKNLATLAK